MNRRLLAGAIAVVVVVAGGTAAVLLLDDEADGPATERATSTATVERRDLVVTETFDGELGYGDPLPLTTGTGGVVTAAVEAGSTVRSGEVLLRVGGEPLVLGTGALPMYRTLSTDSSDGRDVRQLERLLDELGYADDLSVDGEFTSATRDAVEEWEEDLGREDPDGVVTTDEVVFRPGPVRVASAPVVGSTVPPGGVLVEITAVDKLVELSLAVDDATALAAGTAVSITLPDDTVVPGTVTSVGTESRTDPTDPRGAATLPVEVTFDQPRAARAFDAGTVEVEVESSRTQGALVVPVLALLALAEGGYAVELTDGSLVGVEVGTVTDGFAEITGSSGTVQEGTAVVVPR